MANENQDLTSTRLPYSANQPQQEAKPAQPVQQAPQPIQQAPQPVQPAQPVQQAPQQPVQPQYPGRQYAQQAPQQPYAQPYAQPAPQPRPQYAAPQQPYAPQQAYAPQPAPQPRPQYAAPQQPYGQPRYAAPVDNKKGDGPLLTWLIIYFVYQLITVIYIHLMSWRDRADFAVPMTILSILVSMTLILIPFSFRKTGHKVVGFILVVPLMLYSTITSIINLF